MALKTLKSDALSPALLGQSLGLPEGLGCFSRGFLGRDCHIFQQSLIEAGQGLTRPCALAPQEKGRHRFIGRARGPYHANADRHFPGVDGGQDGLNCIDTICLNVFIVIMTMWVPQLSTRRGPRYQAIADALAEDVNAGRLAAGDRLPTHRDLAYELGVTVGTVSRAYAEAERRGLTYGEVGRGTFIQGTAEDRKNATSFFKIHNEVSNQVDFGLNMPAPGRGGDYLARALAELSESSQLEELLAYETHGGLLSHREAAVQILKRFNVETSADQVVICNGAQHAIVTALMSVAAPGDILAVEAVSYPAIKGLAHKLGLKAEALSMDREGLIPDAFDRLCRTRAPKALYCLPTLHNPTTATMSESRRRDIADIARRHGVIILEDDVLGFLVDDAPPSIQSIAPDITYFISGVSKCLAPGLRVGYVVAPDGQAESVISTLNLTSWMAPPLMAEIASRWIMDGVSEELIRWHRTEVAERQSIMRHALGEGVLTSDPAAYHAWLRLPEPWRAEDFAAKAQAAGVRVLPSSTFATGRGAVPPAVRVCLGSPPTQAHVARGADMLASVYSEANAAQSPVF